MFEKQLPAHPNLEQYKKQAKERVRTHALGDSSALERIARNHPRLHKKSHLEIHAAAFSLTDAQLILAREHGFESWPKFARHIETLHLIESIANLTDPVSAFIEVACVPRHAGHGSGTIEHADLILARYPEVATANIHTASILADEPTVRRLLTANPQLATALGGPHGWNPLTHLCFSRYLRLDKSRSEAFVRTAQTLLDHGASANTGWYEMIDHPNPRPTLESCIYGAAGIAQHPGLTKLLLDNGADPNDEETPYHIPETYNNAVMKIVVESGKLNLDSLTTLLIRKADWHDEEGMQWLLERGANPNRTSQWKNSPFYHSVLRDNSLDMIKLLLGHGADPSLINARDNNTSVTARAARRGRADILNLLEQRNIPIHLDPLDQLIAAAAQGRDQTIRFLTASQPHLVPQLLSQGGTLLAFFAGNGNTEGVRSLLDLGIPADALTPEGDPYFELAKNSTALHSAAWRAHPDTVKLLIARGTPLNAVDARGRTALHLAIRACVDSHWTYRRSTESIQALLEAGASTTNIELPTGYDEADALLRQYATAQT
jgi:ankyrin repeat protein